MLRGARYTPGTTGQCPGATLNSATGEFVGRRWALQRVQHWWQRTDEPVLVVTGGPGAGKTSLIKEWVHTVHRSASSRDSPEISAVTYATARTDTAYPAGVLAVLVSRLADTLAPYREFLQRQSGTQQNSQIIQVNSIVQVAEHVEGQMIGVQHQISIGHRFQSEDYHRLIRAPFETLHREGRLPADSVTVVIDGLDEITVDRDDELSFAEAVAQAHPVPGLRLLLTARPATAAGSLRRFPSFDLVRDEPAASHDLVDFVAARLAPVPRPLRDELVGRIVAYCPGQFVLARALTDHLITVHRGGASAAELASLVELPPPAGIAPAWRTLLDKFGGSDHLRDQRYLPVLRIAALARDDGLPGEVLRAAVARYRPGLRAQIGDILTELRDFFRPVERPGAPRRLCHVSLEDYLTDSLERTFEHDASPDDDTVTAHCHLAIALVLGENTRWNGSDDYVTPYAQKHLLTHLVAAVPADREAARQVATDLLGQPEFVEAVTRRLGVERLQWELERLAAGFDHQVWPVNDVAFLLGQQTAHLRNIRSETDGGLLLRQLLHAARACGADAAAGYRRGLAARSQDGLETVWATGGRELTSCVREFEHGHAPVGAVAIVDECRFVTADDDGIASIWDVRSGQRRGLPGDGSRIRAVAASAGWVLTGSGRGTVQVWNVTADTPYPAPSGPPGPVVALAVLPDGERGVSLSAGGHVRLWWLRDAHELDPIEAHQLDPVERERYRPTIMDMAAGRVLTAAANGYIVVTDLQDRSQQMVRKHPGEELTAAALSPDGRFAVTGGAEGGVVLWDLTEEGSPHHLPDQDRPGDLRTGSDRTDQVDSEVTALVVGPGGRFVVAGSGMGARLWDTQRDAGELLMGDAGVSALALVPGGRHVVTASLDHRLRLWNLHSRRLLHLFLGHRDRVRSLAVDGGGLRMVSASYDGTARLWHIPVPAERTVLAGHLARPAAMSVTADGTGLVVADSGGTIWRRNLVDGHGDRPERRSPSRVTALIPTAGEQQMAVGTADGTAGVWDVGTAAFLRRVDPQPVGSHPARVTALVALPGEWAVSAHADGLAQLWDLRTAESLRAIRHNSGFTAAAATLLGDEPAVLLAAEDHTVRLWDTESGQWRWERRDHTMKVLSITVCEDGQHAVTAALDGTVRLWRVSDGVSRGFDTAHRAEATTITAGPGMLAGSGAQDGSAIVWDLAQCTARHHLDHGPAVDAVTAVAFTPSGRHVVTGSSDGGVRLWDVGTMVGRRPTRPRLRLMLDGPVTHLLVPPAGDRAVIATATGQLTCVELP